jgi:hypothetical protein
MIDVEGRSQFFGQELTKAYDPPLILERGKQD